MSSPVAQRPGDAISKPILPAPGAQREPSGFPLIRTVLVAPAWPYANGPRHIGHVAGFAVPADVLARFERLRGSRVLMASGTDEHGTPITYEADKAGVPPREFVDRNNAQIVDDMRRLGMTYDIFTRTTTPNHYHVTQELFLKLFEKGYLVKKTQMGAFDPATGRTLPDRYIEGKCPICGFPDARGDQCDNCDQSTPARQRRAGRVQRNRALLLRPARVRRRAEGVD